MITITQRGSFKNTERYLNRLKTAQRYAILNKYGAIGVNALSNATPIESGETAASWTYSIEERSGYYSIHWRNTHIHEGVPIAILLQYGHGTGTGGYVQGRDFINPAVKPIFDQMADEMWKEVTRI